MGDLLVLSEDDRAGPERSFDRVYELTGDRVPEHLSLELLNQQAGDYVVHVHVTDLLSEGAVEIRRAFRVRPP